LKSKKTEDYNLKNEEIKRKNQNKDLYLCERDFTNDISKLLKEQKSLENSIKDKMEIFEIPEVLSPMEISGIRSRNIPFH
jgi:hypothetical protein